MSEIIYIPYTYSCGHTLQAPTLKPVFGDELGINAPQGLTLNYPCHACSHGHKLEEE